MTKDDIVELAEHSKEDNRTGGARQAHLYPSVELEFIETGEHCTVSTVGQYTPGSHENFAFVESIEGKPTYKWYETCKLKPR